VKTHALGQIATTTQSSQFQWDSALSQPHSHKKTEQEQYPCLCGVLLWGSRSIGREGCGVSISCPSMFFQQDMEVGLSTPFLARNSEISSMQTCSIPPVVPHGTGATISMGLDRHCSCGGGISSSHTTVTREVHSSR